MTHFASSRRRETSPYNDDDDDDAYDDDEDESDGAAVLVLFYLRLGPSVPSLRCRPPFSSTFVNILCPNVVTT